MQMNLHNDDVVSEDSPMMIKQRELSDYPPFCFKMAEGLIMAVFKGK
jgi:hypothetical protein